jgi:hypothetical protein
MPYLHLVCDLCDVVYLPLCATTEEELLTPDFDEVTAAMGERQSLRFQNFYHEHKGHRLNVRSANAVQPQPVETAEKSTKPSET